MQFRDYYATLGVAKTASAKEIKQAYRKLARKFHPDVNPGNKSAESRFKEINEAYEVLGDPDKRKRYDELGANWRQYEQQDPQAGSPFTGFDFGGPAGAAGGARTIDLDEMRRMFGDEDPFSDFFRAFFGGAGPSADRQPKQGRAPRSRQGRDVEHEVELSLEEAFGGTVRRVIIDSGGTHRSIEIRFPAGVGDQSRLRVSGEGEPGTSGGRAGDLYLKVRIPPHPTFERRDAHLYLRVQVPVTTAVLGGEADVPTLDGRRLRLKVPPGTANGQVLRLRGHGMPEAGTGGKRGDLYATVDVKLPTSLTPEARRHYEALAALGE